MPFQPLPGTDLSYALINFDGRGRERDDDAESGVFSRAILERVRQSPPTDIFFFNHGWKGDVPAAIDQYKRWIGALWKLGTDRAAVGASFRPLFIGLHWPSRPWGEEAPGDAAVSFDTSGTSGVDALVDEATKHFGGGEDVRRPLRVIIDAFAEDPAARVLSDEVVAAYQELGAAIGFSAGAGADAPPDKEGAPLDPQAAIRAERMASAGMSFGIGSSIRNGVLAGLRQASFWTMKHRARTVGEEGMHQFVAQLMRASDAPVHLMGHSFGCIVVSGILGGPGGTGTLPRPVASVFLVQGAMSLWSYADTIPHGGGRPGYFQRVLSRQAVSGPIVTTHSVNDHAVGAAFPAAVGLVNEFDFGTELPKFGGIGAWGIQGTTIAEPRAMLDASGAYGFAPGRIYNLDASAFIADHNAIDGPAVAHTLWQAVAASGGARV
jgi:hypothetical protein